MTNEEKAKEIVEQYEVRYNDTRDLLWTDLEDIALQTMQWKDKKFQEVLNYAEICYGVFSFEQRKNFINHIKEIFYGKE